jgi:hypothetical protein
MSLNAGKLERVMQAAEAALQSKGFVAAIDLFLGTGRLQPSDIENWRRGRVPCLERLVLGNRGKVGKILRTFRQWALSKGLRPSETSYVRHTRGSRPELRFTVTGDPNVERAWRTHYVSPALAAKSRRKREQSGPPPFAGQPDTM